MEMLAISVVFFFSFYLHKKIDVHVQTIVTFWSKLFPFITDYTLLKVTLIFYSILLTLTGY